jgi:lysophospholipase L1-like esterase
MSARLQAIYTVDLPHIRSERSLLIRQLIDRSKTYDHVTNWTFTVFADLVEHMRARGIAVLTVQPPSLNSWDFDAEFVARFRSRCGDDLPLIDYGAISEHEELFLPPSIRFDDGHLNADGAVIWSKELAADMARLIQLQAFGRRSDCLSHAGRDRLAPFE